MKVVKKGRYILNAPWHSHHGKEVEVILKRKGISPSYKGKQIYHVAFDPDESYRSEDLDDEFIEENFKPIDEIRCIIDTTMASKETIDLFDDHYRKLKKHLSERMNVHFIERHLGDPFIEDDSLCTFYLMCDKTGKPGLTLDSSGNGELFTIEDE